VTMFLEWIKHNGLMRTLQTDQAFASEVFEVLRKVLGVKVHNMTAVGRSCALGDCEVENKWVQKVITEAGSKGDIKNARDFKIYLARAEIERNQVMKTAGSTVFERIHGFPSLTMGDVMMEAGDGAAEMMMVPAKYADTVAPLLAERSAELVAQYQAYSNDRHYKASFDTDSDVQYKAQAAQVFEKGAKVTWLNNNKNPEQGTVVRVFYDGGEPKTAMVDTGSQRKKVQYTALKEKSAKRPQWSVELTLHLEKGMMVFWQCEGELVGGLILEMDSGDFGERMKVHYYAENISWRVWLPLWNWTGSEECFRAKDCPEEGMEGTEEWLSVDMAEKAGYIKETFYLEEDTLLMLQSWLQ
jgi:hypothetical protein